MGCSIVAIASVSGRAAAPTSWTSPCAVGTAVVESIERDYEDVIHVAVLVDDDPGKDLGALSAAWAPLLLRPRRPRARGTTEELAVSEATILVAGIGNIFLGDDGFGVEVARQVASPTAR